MATAMSSGQSMGVSQITPVSSAPSSHPFTCNTCQVAFRSGELQRGHMRSDWQYVFWLFVLECCLTTAQPIQSQTEGCFTSAVGFRGLCREGPDCPSIVISSGGKGFL